MKRALDYVLLPDYQEPDGYLGKSDGSRMYGHGITTLMLVEMLGMGADERQDALIRERSRKAIDLIIRSQRVPKNDANRGGWRCLAMVAAWDYGRERRLRQWHRGTTRLTADGGGFLSLAGPSSAVHRRKMAQATSLACWHGGGGYVRG